MYGCSAAPDRARRAARLSVFPPQAWLALAIFAVALAGCSTLPRSAPPLDVIGTTVIPGFPEVRTPAGWPSEAMTADLARSYADESRTDFPVGPDGLVRYANLAISGGGPNGAFGSGLLKGWTDTGKRPVFKIVTGVSTGALMAPFAFLGSEYDQSLHDFYTTNPSQNIFRRLSLLPQLLSGESFAETGPLRLLIEEHANEKLLAAVAAAHRAGRRLYIGTVDLDAQRFVIWNMGLIATSGQPQALDIFRKVMLASASIPVAFPPVLFDVVAKGERYDELHVDGAVGANVFLSGGIFSIAEVRAKHGKLPGREDIYIIHNGQLRPRAEPTRRSLVGIAIRSFDGFTRAGMIGDLFRIYATTQRDQAGFRWITIPDSAELSGNEVFDPVVMGNLYTLGVDLGRKGPPWETEPPGFRTRQQANEP